ncbi:MULTISPECIES: ABC transporter substrate-binding protein [Kitasatospora]|uniref:Putative peptide ABC transporter substrate-binding protein n=1 Tax=Kitasatospora setae (strain ATCC 33774 / DSM 43861 / JCM 3304 / KCC A-0304 / NBRC 14216 / KM-6054) TaxID=452652 RepID=E4N2E0_KITSK|nr:MULTISPECIES: ABC transporter substrate-binding protein [Kitasatospora]BAJ32324.1 putative peptide ABC transporter substrate-binding protein [Kitasatospora setae KM-6054]
MRIPRPGPARVLVPAVAAALLLTGCSGAKGGGTSADAGKPVAGGTLTYAVDTEPVSWDPHVSTQDLTAELQRQVFDSLVSEDADGKFHPWLATSWEVAPDLKSFTFHLRTDVKFHDGTPFDAAAVKANFDHIVAKDTKSQYAANLLGSYTGTTVVDPATVRIDFAQPSAPFLQAASTTYLGFYSPKALADSAAKLGQGGTADVGTGPFKFVSYSKGQEAVFEKNPAYNWAPPTAKHNGPAYLDKFVVRFLPDASVRVGALSSGQVQVAKAVPPQSVATVKADSKLKLLTQAQPGGNYNLWLNGSLAPLDDQKVRQAVQRGIDVDLDVKSVQFGQFPRAWSPISATTPGYAKELEGSWPFDQSLSNKLLDEAGWTGRDGDGYRTKDGKRLTLVWPQLTATATQQSRDILGQAFQADLKKIGVEVQRPALDVGGYSTLVYGGKANIVDLAWARFEPDVLWLFLNSASDPAKGGINATFLPDAQLDEWTNAARATLDAGKRAELYAKVQKRAVDLATVVPVYTPHALTGSSAKVGGLSFDSDTWLSFYDTWRTA